jgi:hypothetical protein
LFSCNNKQNNHSETEIVETVQMNKFYELQFNNDKLMDSLFERIEKYGDTLAYIEVFHISTFANYKKSNVIHYYSEIMAKKYNYSLAYYHQFISFRYDESKELRKFALYNLLKAHELGCKEVDNDIEYIFKGKKVPTSKEFLANIDKYSNIEIPIY